MVSDHDGDLDVEAEVTVVGSVTGHNGSRRWRVGPARSR